MASLTIECGCGSAFTVEIVGGQPATSMLCPRCGKDGMEAACRMIARKSPAYVAASLPMGMSGGGAPPQPAPSRSATPAAAPVASGAFAAFAAPPPSAPPPLPPRTPSRAGGLSLAPASVPPPPPLPRKPEKPAWSPGPPAGEGGESGELPGEEEEHLEAGEHWSLEPEVRERAEVEARAKIMWGDPQEEVIKYLRDLCFSEKQAAAMVQDLYKERLVAVRSKGVKKMLIGGGLICIPVTVYLVMDLGYHIEIRSLKAVGSLAGIGVLGCWLLFDGSIKWFSPHLERGDVAVPD